MVIHPTTSCGVIFAFGKLSTTAPFSTVTTRTALIELTIQTSSDPVEAFRWRGSWRASQLKYLRPSLCSIDCSNLFSDALHRPFSCSQINLAPCVEHIPPRNAIRRFPYLTSEEFENYWADTPFILTDVVNHWPLFKGWCFPELLDKYGDIVFRAEAFDWSLRTYLEYLNDCHDESPVYLFDHTFAEKMRLNVGVNGVYWPPACFGHDLFTLLRDQRPEHRWLIIGPERSGSTFHKDPNATSAWNAVIRGSKYWIMFPRSVLPPGVHMSEDQSEVTSPLSIAEWLLTFHNEARQTPGCIEGICHEGEVLHVPSGWWHLVVNLQSAIAITQNFVPVAHLKEAITFLETKPEQVSGFATDVSDPYALFIQRLNQQRPDLVHLIEQTHERKRKWETVVSRADEGSRQPNGFTFGFGNDIDGEDD